MKQQSTLASRGLLLAIGPLLFQSLFALLIACLLTLSWNKEAHRANEISELKSICAEVAQAGYLRATNHTTDDKTEGLESVEKARIHLATFINRAANQPQLDELAKTAQEIQNVGEGVLSEAEVVHERRGQSPNIDDTALMLAVRRALKSLQESSDKLELSSGQSLLSGFASIDNAPRLGTLSIMALCGSLILATLAAIFYYIRIFRPLKKLADRADRLVEGTTFTAPIPQPDEIGKVSQVLAESSQNMQDVLTRLKTLEQNATDVICTVSEYGNFTSFNPCLKKMLHYQADDLIGKKLTNIVSPEDVTLIEDRLRDTINSKKTDVGELRLKKNDGTAIDTNWSILWSSLERSFYCVVHDTTEQKRIEDLKQDFVNMVTHDLRSPLTALFGSLKLIAAGAKGPVSPLVESEINIAANNVSKLCMFVNDLLDFQKLRVGKMQLNLAECALEEIIEETVEFVRSVAESKNIALRVHAGHCVIRCDKPKLLQTITNLISNAIKFSPEDEAVDIEIAEFPNSVQVSVIDRGPGVPAQFQERIFEAFEQVPATAKLGTGLGLAICKLIVEAHGGSIGVVGGNLNQSDPSLPNSSGSKFWFRIPK